MTTLLFDRSGHRLVCAGDSQIVEVWDLDARKRIAEFYGHTNRITHVALSPDEGLAATAGREGTVRLWSMKNSVESTVLPSAAGADKMEFAAGGSLLVVGGGGKARAFDTTGWREQFSCNAKRFAVSVGPAGDFLATYRNRECVVQRIKTREEVGFFKLDREDLTISDLALSADGQDIVVADGWRVKHWNVRSHGPPRVVGEIPGNYVSVSMSPREPTVASSNDKRALAVFQNEYIGVPRPRNEALGPAGVVRQIRYNGDGTLFAGASTDRSVYVWDAETNKLKTPLIGHEAPVNCVAFSPDGKTLASGDDAGIVRLWDLQSRHEALHLKAHSQAVKSLAFSPDGRLLATATAHAPEKSGEVRIWFADPPAK